MKDHIRIGALLALAGLALGGCGAKPEPPASSSQETPLQIETLRVELPRTLDTAAARAAMERLPELLAAEGVALAEVSVTFGTSYAATADALEGGGVDLAFLPAADYVDLCSTAAAVLADGAEGLTLDETAEPSAWNAGEAEPSGELAAGTFALICAAPSAYGKTLAAALSHGRDAAWEELCHARWGVLDADSEAGYRCLELWLEDHYEGSGVEDLDSVTRYDSWDALITAAAEEEIDLLPLPADLRRDRAARWTLETDRTDETGGAGFGRAADIWTELPVLAVTERLYSFVAAVSAENAAVSDARFAPALAAALERAFDGPAERAAALGAGHYVPIAPDALDGLRRLEFGR